MPAAATSAVATKQKSGAQWVARFPGSAKVDDLEPVFKEKLKSFLAALKEAGASVAIAATYRPRKRAYLMHYCVRIVKGEIKADKVPAMEGVDIDWNHEDDAASVKAAQAMMDAYDIVFPPALISRHTERAAVDMTISKIIGKKIKDAEGNEVEIKALSDLHPVGKSYGVIKLVSDKPHWSDNGT
ncbi:hypothetical protein CDL60_16030 [Roseateles noduli]|nr:hypothetical protein CDL60_16030 [Roseateles noduli]